MKYLIYFTDQFKTKTIWAFIFLGVSATFFFSHMIFSWNSKKLITKIRHDKIKLSKVIKKSDLEIQGEKRYELRSQYIKDKLQNRLNINIVKMGLFYTYDPIADETSGEWKEYKSKLDGLSAMFIQIIASLEKNKIKMASEIKSLQDFYENGKNLETLKRNIVLRQVFRKLITIKDNVSTMKLSSKKKILLFNSTRKISDETQVLLTAIELMNGVGNENSIYKINIKKLKKIKQLVWHYNGSNNVIIKELKIKQGRLLSFAKLFFVLFIFAVLKFLFDKLFKQGSDAIMVTDPETDESQDQNIYVLPKDVETPLLNISWDSIENLNLQEKIKDEFSALISSGEENEDFLSYLLQDIAILNQSFGMTLNFRNFYDLKLNSTTVKLTQSIKKILIIYSIHLNSLDIPARMIFDLTRHENELTLKMILKAHMLTSKLISKEVAITNSNYESFASCFLNIEDTLKKFDCRMDTYNLYFNDNVLKESVIELKLSMVKNQNIKGSSIRINRIETI